MRSTGNKLQIVTLCILETLMMRQCVSTACLMFHFGPRHPGYLYSPLSADTSGIRLNFEYRTRFLHLNTLKLFKGSSCVFSIKNQNELQFPSERSATLRYPFDRNATTSEFLKVEDRDIQDGESSCAQQDDTGTTFFLFR